MLDVPVLLQTDEYRCGPVSLEMVLSYDGIPAAKWVRQLANPLTGLEPSTLVAVLTSAYAERTLHGTMTVPLLKSLTQQNRPVIALVTDAEVGGHWVVVKGVFRGKVYLNCPTNGAESLPEKDFVDAWRWGSKSEGLLLRFGAVGFPE